MDIISALANYLNTGDYQNLVLVLVFVTTVLMIVGLALWVLFIDNPTERRVREIAEGRKIRDNHQPHKEGLFNVLWLEPLVELVMPADDWKRSRIKTKLVLAGHMGPNAIKTFMVLKILLALALPLLIVLPFILFGIVPVSEPSKVVPYLVLSALFGYYLPDIVAYQQKKARQLLFTEGFPDAMDMMVVCVEAGLGIDAAIVRVANEIGISHPELAREFHMVSLELRAGKTREQALRALGERTGVLQVQSLAALLIQAEHFGTSVARALREHAEEMRNIRMQTARETAAKLPVKLIFPLMLFIFPALFLVILAPAAIRIYLGFVVGVAG
ncbi:MAG: type II secretion system F family protein [Gammaproteobacteria bacterium]|nr:type II secretion system F family protein [Gammaproteobacteria bacterium]MCW8923647.1 type II secretion system F family protein [Gammaproteobacteria bacterium]